MKEEHIPFDFKAHEEENRRLMNKHIIAHAKLMNAPPGEATIKAQELLDSIREEIRVHSCKIPPPPPNLVSRPQ